MNSVKAFRENSSVFPALDVFFIEEAREMHRYACFREKINHSQCKNVHILQKKSKFKDHCLKWTFSNCFNKNYVDNNGGSPVLLPTKLGKKLSSVACLVLSGEFTY